MLRLIGVLWFVCFTAGRVKPGKTIKDVATVPGDIILGGLFPVHSSGSQKCQSLNPERGIQRVEAMLFTLDEINNNTSLLPGLRLGANIRDTCSLGNYALEQSLDFVKTSVADVLTRAKETQRDSLCPCAHTPTLTASESSNVYPSQHARPVSWSQDIVRGVVGGSYSTVSILVANLYRLFHLPQISYASTSAVLSDKRTYPLFARTVPSDVEQARAMADLVAEYNWTYVSTVRSAGDYGDSGMDAFWKEADKRGICIAAREVIRGSFTGKDLDEMVKVLRHSFSKARVVVLFTRMDHTQLLLDAVRRANLSDHFVWIASDGWGRENVPVANNSRVANGALTIEILAEEIDQFSVYYKNLQSDNTRNPWFAKYWESLFGCTFENATSPTPDSNKQKAVSSNGDLRYVGPTASCFEGVQHRLGDKLSRSFKQEAKIQFVYDAVYAFAWGLHKLQESICPFNPDPAKWDKNECIRKLLSHPGKEFYETIIKTSFKDNYGNHVAFDENGDGVGQYLIYNYARNLYTGEYQYRLVGDYQKSKLTMRSRPIWPGGQSRHTPSSQCSEDCPFGSVRQYSKKQQCCWTCEECQHNQIIINVTHCETCPDQYWPSENRSICELLELHYIQPSSWFAIVPMILNCIGILATIAVIVTLALYSETPIVRATGRELTYLLLSGCLLCYLSSVLLLAKPTPAACAIQRVGIGLGFAIMYASLLTKTNRLARIFDAAKKTTKRPAFISPRSQLAIAGGLVGLQFALTAIWLGFDPPSTRVDPIVSNFLVLRCAIKDSSMVTSLAYIMLLIVVCTIYAVKTRCIPENFNESKFIGFAMYTTCIIWLAFVPIYFATMSNFEIQISTLSVAVSLSATVTMICLFAPKMYIIYFQPEKNIRKLTMNSSTGNRNKYAACKSPPESYARQSSSVGTECVLSNPLFTTSSQPSTLITISESKSIERAKSYIESPEQASTKRLLLNTISESSFGIDVTPLVPVSEVMSECYPESEDRCIQANSCPEQPGRPRLASYQAIVSPMPLLLDSVAGSIASVPAYLYDEDHRGEREENQKDNDSSTSSASMPSSSAYSRKPTPSEISIENPKLDPAAFGSRDDLFVYQNPLATFGISSPQVTLKNNKPSAVTVSNHRGVNSTHTCWPSRNPGSITTTIASDLPELWEQATTLNKLVVGRNSVASKLSSPAGGWHLPVFSGLTGEEKLSSV